MDKLITEKMVLFFDMDGTLVDTNYANFLSYQKAIQNVMGLKLEFEFNSEHRFNRIALKKSIPNLNDLDYDRIIEEKKLVYPDFLSETKLISSTVDILSRFSVRNKAFLISNCSKDRIFLQLGYFNLIDKFHKIFCKPNDYKANKYQIAINNLGVVPKLVVVFENEESEIINAKNAGIPSANIIKL